MRNHEANVAKLKAAVLEGKGVTSPALRQAIEARVAAEAGAVRSEVSTKIPADLARYAAEVGRDALAVTAADLEGLKAAGHSEDVIFEVTVAAALGASLARHERALALLAEARS